MTPEEVRESKRQAWAEGWMSKATGTYAPNPYAVPQKPTLTEWMTRPMIDMVHVDTVRVLIALVSAGARMRTCHFEGTATWCAAVSAWDAALEAAGVRP